MLLVGSDVYERLIKGYTEKQWGRKCTALPAFIIKRLPVRLTYDNNYFSDAFQGIPIIEHKHFEHFGQHVYDLPKTIISREYPTEWIRGAEPFYPVNDARNSAIYQQYKQLADKELRVIFGGRLAEYKYYDIAPIIERVLFTDIYSDPPTIAKDRIFIGSV